MCSGAESQKPPHTRIVRICGGSLLYGIPHNVAVGNELEICLIQSLFVGISFPQPMEVAILASRYLFGIC